VTSKRCVSETGGSDRAAASAAGAEAPGARLFVGLWPQAPVRAGIVHWQAACTWPAGAHPTPPERLHLTLHFLGQVERQRIPALVRALDLPSPRFDLLLDRATVWSNGVAVLEPGDDVPAALLEFHGRLGEALQRLDVPLETRPFRPHVTLARRAKGAVFLAGAASVHWPVRGHVLVESDRGYQVLQCFP
jgi:2'-5' RNA ligase